MCTAEATLAYGLTVPATAVYFAVKAWPRLKPVLRFFDFVFLRRRKGTLSILPESDAVAKVPDEVWEEIRYQLVQHEIADSEDRLLGPLLCDSPICPVRPSISSMVRWRSFRKSGCTECRESFEEWTSEELNYWPLAFVHEIRQLLASFGLAFPVTQPITTRPGQVHFYDSLALIAAPSQLRHPDGSQSVTFSADCHGDEGPDEHTLIDISVALPRKIVQRFLRVIRYFNFDVINSSVNKLSNKVTRVNEGRKNSIERAPKDAKLSGVQKRLTNKIKPKWKLWMTCVSDW